MYSNKKKKNTEIESDEEEKKDSRVIADQRLREINVADWKHFGSKATAANT